VAGHLLIRTFTLGPLDTNCYLAADPASGQSIIIDPAEPSPLLVETVRSEHFSIEGIVATHAHGDHIGGNDALKVEFGCPIMVHEREAAALTDSYLNLSTLAGIGCIESPPADRLLRDGDQIRLGDLSLRVIHTPGHSPGSLCLHVNGVLFSGDTLFAGGIGRTDFPGGSMEEILDSIRTRLMALPDDTIVYPGHGPETTIGDERRHNPFLQESET